MAHSLDYLFIHCTATPEGREVTPDDIIRWHTSPKSQGGRGWDRVGYRSLVMLDGSIHKFVDANHDAFVQPSEITYGAAGYNHKSHHVCYAGGTNATGHTKDTRTVHQYNALGQIILFYVEHINPQIKIIGHNQVSNKGCPSFWVPKFCKELGLLPLNIYEKDPFQYARILG